MARLIADMPEGAQLRVTAIGKHRRRAGRSFTREAAILDGADLTDDHAIALFSDRELKIELGSDGEFVEPPRDEIDALLADYQGAAQAIGAEAVASDVAYAARHAAAPIGGGQTGSGFVREGASAERANGKPGKGAGTIQEPETDRELAPATDGLPAGEARTDTPPRETVYQPAKTPAKRAPRKPRAPKTAAIKNGPATPGAQG